MANRLDVWSAVRDANDIFWRWPRRFCLPIVVCGAVSWLLAEMEKANSGVLIGGLLSFAMGFVTQWAQVSVSAMYLKARAGEQPVFRQIGETRRYPALWPTIWSLFGWYLLWGLGFGALAAVPWYLWHKAVEQGQEGIEIAGYAVGIPAAAIYFAWVASRYAFALPLVAIRKRSTEGLADLSERESRGCRGTLMVLMIAGSFPASVFYLENQFVFGPHLSMHGLGAGIDFVQSLLADCISAWFTLLMTQIALQRFSNHEVDFAVNDLSTPPPPLSLGGLAE